MNIFKKIVTSKDFVWLMAIQIVVFTGLFLFVVFTTKPINEADTKEIKLYSPSVSLESVRGIDKSNSKIIKIRSQDCEYVCGNRTKVVLKDNAEDSFYAQLEMDNVLIITYVQYPKTNAIVAIQGDGHTYYTIDDYNSFYKKNFIAGIIAISCLDLVYLLFSVCWILEFVLGISTKVNLLRKKHPIEKHVYTDEENEFSPYKQKLLDKDREEEANSD